MSKEALTKKIEEFLYRHCTIWGSKDDTWRDWFEDVLITLLNEGEGFSGKRPNCNSGWQCGLAEALVFIEPNVVTQWVENEDGRYAHDIDWSLYRAITINIVTYCFQDRRESPCNTV